MDALEFGVRGHHREEELALAFRRVGSRQLARQDPQADAAPVQVVANREQILNRPPHPVEFPRDDGRRRAPSETERSRA
jgi:hypothetical protein